MYLKGCHLKKLSIDLALKVLPLDHPVFMVRPGMSYHLLRRVHKFEAIAPDYPFLSVPDGVAPSNAEDIEAQTSRAISIRQWANTPHVHRERMPTANLDAYRLGHSENKASRTRLNNTADEILWDLPDGALIFVPAPALSDIGFTAELAKNTDPRVIMSGDEHRSSVKYLGRSLHGLQQILMRNLPEAVTDRVRDRVVSARYEGYARDRLLRAHYGDYQLGHDTAVMEFIANDEKFDAKTMARVTALAETIERFIATGQFDEPGNLLYASNGRVQSQVHATINSKGGRLLIEGPQMVPHIIRSLLIVAQLAGPAASADELSDLMHRGSLGLKNSKGDASSIEIVEAAERTLIDLAVTAGQPSLKVLLEGLADSTESSKGRVDGTAAIE